MTPRPAFSTPGRAPETVARRNLPRPGSRTIRSVPFAEPIGKCLPRSDFAIAEKTDTTSSIAGLDSEDVGLPKGLHRRCFHVAVRQDEACGAGGHPGGSRSKCEPCGAIG